MLNRICKLEAPEIYFMLVFGGFVFYVLFMWRESITLAGIGAVIGALISFVMVLLGVLEGLAWPIITIKNRKQAKKYKSGNGQGDA